MKRNNRTIRKLYKATDSLSYIGLKTIPGFLEICFKNFSCWRKNLTIVLSVLKCNDNRSSWISKEKIYTYKKIMRYCYEKNKEFKNNWR